MKLDENVEIQSPNLSAKIPIKSTADYGFSFYLSIPKITSDAQRKEIIDRIQQSFPFLEGSSWGNNVNLINFSTNESKTPGISKYLTTMFTEAGVHMRFMGVEREFEAPPYWDISPEPQNLPFSAKKFDSFKELICGTVNAALTGPKVTAKSEDSPTVG